MSSSFPGTPSVSRGLKIMARLLSKIKGYENATPVGSRSFEGFRSRDDMKGGGSFDSNCVLAY